MAIKSRRTKKYMKLLRQLPDSVQRDSVKAYALWKQDPYHPSLHFKKFHRNVWSARVNQNYRALGLWKSTGMYWFWIGKHNDYDSLIDHLKEIVSGLRS